MRSRRRKVDAMRLWLDDDPDRTVPPGFDVVVRTAPEAIKLIQSGKIQHVSLDHDLGGQEAGTGYDVAKWIEEQAHAGSLPRLGWDVHSANPVGASRIRQALVNADRFWNMRETKIAKANVKISAKKFTKDEANAIAADLGIDFENEDFDLDQFYKGVNVELEHGTKVKKTDVSGDDPFLTGKIAWAHLLELPDHYDRLTTMEQAAEQEKQASALPRRIAVYGRVYERVAVSGRELNPRQLADKIEMYTKDIVTRMQSEISTSVAALKAAVKDKDENDLAESDMKSLRDLEERCNSLYEDAWKALDDIKQLGNGKPVAPEKPESEEPEVEEEA